MPEFHPDGGKATAPQVTPELHQLKKKVLPRWRRYLKNDNPDCEKITVASNGATYLVVRLDTVSDDESAQAAVTAVDLDVIKDKKGHYYGVITPLMIEACGSLSSIAMGPALAAEKANAINDRLLDSAMNLIRTMDAHGAWDGQLSPDAIRREFSLHIPSVEPTRMLAAAEEAPPFEATIEPTGCWMMMKSLIDNLDGLPPGGDIIHRGESRDSNKFSSSNFDTISKVFGGISRTVCNIGAGGGAVDPSAVIDTITGSIGDLMNSKKIDKDSVRNEVLIMRRTLPNKKKQYLGIRYYYKMHISDITKCGKTTHNGSYEVKQTYVVAPSEDIFTEAFGKIFPEVTELKLEFSLTALLNREGKMEIAPEELIPLLKKKLGSSLLDVADVTAEKPVSPDVLSVLRLKAHLSPDILLALAKETCAGSYVRRGEGYHDILVRKRAD